MTPDTKQKARIEILSYVLSTCITRRYGIGRENLSPGYRGFTSTGFSDDRAVAGDLVILQSAPASKWAIGWLLSVDESNPGWPRYLIESLDDGAQAWWDNVGVDYLDREIVSNSPQWRWTDRQWAFRDRWTRLCYKAKNAHIVRPMQPEFGRGYEVTLGTRTSYGFDDIRPSRTFPDWRKVTKAMMAQCYDDCVAERDQILAERKAAA